MGGRSGRFLNEGIGRGLGCRYGQSARMADPETPGTYHVHTHASGAEHWRHVIEIAAFIVAAGWAFYVFIYQEQIKPASMRPQGQFIATLSHHMVPSSSEFVSIEIDIHNTGTVAFRPAGYVVNAYGYRYLPRITQTTTKSISGNVTSLNRALAETHPVLLQSVYAKFLNFGSVRAPFLVGPGGDSKNNVGFGISRGAYDVIFLRYKWCVARYGDTQVYDPGMYRDSQGAYWFRYINTDPNPPLFCGQTSRLEFPL
jgi:hypothetical protein